jgi:hypothetical protein
MIRQFLLVSIIWGYGFSCFSQSEPREKLIDKTFNWGIKAGFNALTPVKYKVSDEIRQVSDQETKNKVSYFGAFFTRINLSKFFMQPEFSYYRTKEVTEFSLSNPGSDIARRANLTLTTYSFNIPVLLGYNLEKESRYLLNVFTGPNFKYDYKNRYRTGSLEFEELDRELSLKKVLNLDYIVGMSVNISNLYFDFRYEIDLSESQVNFNEVSNSPSFLKGLKVHKRENMLSFSCGLMF